jgi:hypothetical protein
MNSSAPRLAGRRLRLALQLLRSPAGGPLRRLLAKQLFDAPFSSLDLARAGDPPPYVAVGFRKPTP